VFKISSSIFCQRLSGATLLGTGLFTFVEVAVGITEGETTGVVFGSMTGIELELLSGILVQESKRHNSVNWRKCFMGKV
jgi:hypothetical protein